MCMWNGNLTINYDKNIKYKELDQGFIMKANNLIIEKVINRKKIKRKI